MACRDGHAPEPTRSRAQNLDGWRSAGDPAAVHATMAHAYSLKARNFHNQAQVDEGALKSTQRHIDRSIQSLVPLVKAACRQETRETLTTIKDACLSLAACEMTLGNRDASSSHWHAAIKVISVMGGLRTLPEPEVDVITRTIVGLAGILHTRPMIHPDEWDPGAWSEGNLEQGAALFDEAQPALELSRPTTVSPPLRLLFDEIRELLMIEEIKTKLGSLEHLDAEQQDEAMRLFRWSHLRKAAVYGRSLLHWCDLAEPTLAVERIPVSVPMPAVVRSSTFDMCLALATRLFQRATFEEHYFPQGLFRQCKVTHTMLVSTLVNMRPVFDQISRPSDEREFDLFWICSVGAYIEGEFLPRTEANDSSADLFFGVRFSLLARNLHLNSMGHATQFLQRHYLYCPRLQDASLRKLLDVKT